MRTLAGNAVIMALDAKKLMIVCLCCLFLFTGCAAYNTVRDFFFKPKEVEPVEVLERIEGDMGSKPGDLIDFMFEIYRSA